MLSTETPIGNGMAHIRIGYQSIAPPQSCDLLQLPQKQLEKRLVSRP
jgi:hypothetical protein